MTRAALLLPHQGPLGVFVHHNTFGVLEHLEFQRALELVSEELQATVRPGEDELRGMLADGRIDLTDLRALFDAESDFDGELAEGALPSKRELAWSVLVSGLVNVHWRIRAFEMSVGRPDPVLQALGPARRALLAEGARRLFARNAVAAAHLITGTDVPALVRQRLRQQLGIEDVEGCVQAVTAVPGRADELGLALMAGLARRGLPPIAQAPVSSDMGWIEREVDELLLPLLASWLDRGTLSVRPRQVSLFEDGLAVLRAHPRLWRHVRPLANARAHATLVAALGVVGARDEADMETVLRSIFRVRPGWAGAVRWREQHIGDVRLLEYAALRLLARIACAYAMKVPPADGLGDVTPTMPGLGTRSDRVAQVLALAEIGPDRAQQLTPEHWRQIETFTSRIDVAWRCRLLQEARERTSIRRWLVALACCESHPVRDPEVQFLCCIDDREESFRRALEECGGACVETFGVAGFFNLPLAFRRAGASHDDPSHPASMRSTNRVVEPAVLPSPLRRTMGRVGWALDRGSVRPLGGMLAAVGFGVWAAAWIAARVFAAPHSTGWLEPSSRVPQRAHGLGSLDPWTREEPTESIHDGFTIEAAADAVYGAIAPLGLARGFAPVVVLVGHGSSSLNNPHESAHDCGACGGHRGDANARVFAVLANRREVRTALTRRGLVIPTDTVFVGAYHDTATDAVDLWWPDDIEGGAASMHESLRRLVDQAAARDARERSRRFASAEHDVRAGAALQHVRGRAVDFAQVRPEYGHATNALLIVGPRDRTRGLFLDRRAFLQSYDPESDASGGALSGLLAATVPVCAGINLEYYFSRVDNEHFGAGTKIPHNVVGLHGVMNGAGGDLRTGLPRQMVEIHEPTRLLVVVHAPRARVLEAVARLPNVARLVSGGWVHLAALDAEGIWVLRDGAWIAESPTTEPLPEVPDSTAWYGVRRDDLAVARIVGSPQSRA